MRYLILSIFCITSIFALTPREAYKKATTYEMEGNTSEAMKWYKKAADLAMPITANPITKKTPSYMQDEKSSFNETQKAYREYFTRFDNNQTEETVEQMLTGIFGLQPYHINYLLPVVYDSSNHENRKHYETQFQLSFKKTMFSDLFGFNEKYAFGYTQTSWWQTFKTSKPFRETNYRPEIFVYGFYGDKESFLKGYQFGFLHESNGRDKERSRSWNRLYLTTFWQLGNFFVAPRVWYRIPESEKEDVNDENGDDNPDIESYLGYGDLTIAFPYREHVITAKLRNNLRFNSQNRGALNLEWTFPLWSKNFFGYFNFFTGYGSSLEDYNTHSNRIGLGFALSR